MLGSIIPLLQINKWSIKYQRKQKKLGESNSNRTTQNSRIQHQALRHMFCTWHTTH